MSLPVGRQGLDAPVSGRGCSADAKPVCRALFDALPPDSA
jgi:hypothetical protein